MINDARKRHNESLAGAPLHEVEQTPVAKASKPSLKKEGAARVKSDGGWSKQLAGVAALLGCVGVWAAGSWLESSK
jgi:hypothetical protein